MLIGFGGRREQLRINSPCAFFTAEGQAGFLGVVSVKTLRVIVSKDFGHQSPGQYVQFLACAGPLATSDIVAPGLQLSRFNLFQQG